MEWVKILVSALAGLAAAIPLVVELESMFRKQSEKRTGLRCLIW